MNNILNVHHEEIPFEIHDDCTDKVIVIKTTGNLDERKYKALKAVMNYMKETCGAKASLVLPTDMSFESLDTEDAIYLINSYIDQLYNIKESLLEDEGD